MLSNGWMATFAVIADVNSNSPTSSLFLRRDVFLFLCSSAFTIAQDMDSLSGDVKKRIDDCIEKYRSVLD